MKDVDSLIRQWRALIMALVLPLLVPTIVNADDKSSDAHTPGTQASASVIPPRYPCEDDLIEVMFDWGAKIRLVGGQPADYAGSATAGIQNVLGKLGSCSWNRICDVSEEKFDEIQARGENGSREPVYNLNNILYLRIPDGLDVWLISGDLESLPGIMQARPVPKPAPAPVYPPSYVPQQGYLGPASSTPAGIGATLAWTYLGGDGTGVTVCDLEYSWFYSHFDLTKAPGSQINTNVSDPFSDDNHGTAVIGELVSDANGWGTTGVCFASNLKTCGTYFGAPTPWWNVAGAIGVAIANLLPGDVILLEQQWDYSGTGAGA